MNKGEGMWGPSAGIVAGILGIVAACTEDQTFVILYRIQSAVSCVSVGTTLSAFLGLESKLCRNHGKV